MSDTGNQENNSESADAQLPRSQRIALALQAWKDADGQISMKKAARMYNVSSSTLQGRIKGAIPKEQASQAMQRLSKEQEDALVEWIDLLTSWGWPARTDQLRGLAREFLRAKGDTSELGVHWHDGFIQRHPEAKTKYARKMDKERTQALSQEPSTIRSWFELFREIVTKYNIHRDDIYNMDERSWMIGILGKGEIMVSRHERRRQNTLKVAPNNRWASVIECVASTGRIFPPWVIVKGDQQLQVWHDILRGTDGKVLLSKDGWSNNELGVDWLKVHFERYSTPLNGDGEYRLLILDGNALQLSTQAIQFCIAAKIILLCLPPYSTQFLQPLDPGVFLPMANIYEQAIRQHPQFVVNYYVGEAEFLRIYLHSRQRSTSIQQIQKAWEAVGLEPLNPELVVSQLPPVVAQTPVPPGPPGIAMYSQPNGDAFHVPLQQGHAAQMDDLVNPLLGGYHS